MVKKANNEKEFLELIDRYDSITLKEIEDKMEDPEINDEAILDNQKWSFVRRELTGFGRMSTCTLCLAINGACSKCMYGVVYDAQNDTDMMCVDKSGPSRTTYMSIEHASSSEELLEMYKKRAKFMRKTLDEYNQNQ